MRGSSPKNVNLPDCTVGRPTAAAGASPKFATPLFIFWCYGAGRTSGEPSFGFLGVFAGGQSTTRAAKGAIRLRPWLTPEALPTGRATARGSLDHGQQKASTCALSNALPLCATPLGAAATTRVTPPPQLAAGWRAAVPAAGSLGGSDARRRARTRCNKNKIQFHFSNTRRDFPSATARGAAQTYSRLPVRWPVVQPWQLRG